MHRAVPWSQPRVQIAVSGEANFTHFSLAQLVENSVVREALADHGASHYGILEKLGGGGVVYKAEDTRLTEFLAGRGSSRRRSCRIIRRPRLIAWSRVEA